MWKKKTRRVWNDFSPFSAYSTSIFLHSLCFSSFPSYSVLPIVLFILRSFCVILLSHCFSSCHVKAIAFFCVHVCEWRREMEWSRALQWSDGLLNHCHYMPGGVGGVSTMLLFSNWQGHHSCTTVLLTSISLPLLTNCLSINLYPSPFSSSHSPSPCLPFLPPRSDPSNTSHEC